MFHVKIANVISFVLSLFVSFLFYSNIAFSEPANCSYNGFQITCDDTDTSNPWTNQYREQVLKPYSKEGLRGREGKSYFEQFYNKMKKDEHPWNPYNPNSMMMWCENSDPIHKDKQGDSYHIIHDYQGTGILDPDAQLFYDCLEPSLVQRYCEYCQPFALPLYVDPDCSIPFVNFGQVVDYWWPTIQVEINNFGISALNPSDESSIIDNKKLWSDKMPGIRLRKISGKEAVAQYAREKLKNKLQSLKEEYLDMTQDSLEKSGILKEGSNMSNSISSYKDIVGASMHAGTKGGSRTYESEAHAYLTELQTSRSWIRNQGWGTMDFLYDYDPIFGICMPYFSFLYNGFTKGNPESCFYDTLEPDVDAPKVWTENEYFRPFWLYPGCSEYMDETGGLYADSRPTMDDVRGIPSESVTNEDGTTTNYYWTLDDSCPAYRAATKLQPRMENLNVGPLPFEGHFLLKYLPELWANCYEGGWQLYPPVGVEYSQSVVTGPSVLARRAAELAGQRANCALTSRSPNTCGHYPNAVTAIRDHINRFTRLEAKFDIDCNSENLDYTVTADPSNPHRTEIDKIQILFPRVFDKNGDWIITETNMYGRNAEGYDYPSKCFRMHELEELDHGSQEGVSNPADILLAKHHGSIRFVIWEKRRACFCPYRGIHSYPERNNGPDYWTSPGVCPTCIQDQGWGCVNYPVHNMDLGRGNVAAEEYTDYLNGVDLDGHPADYISWFCNYPYKYFRDKETDSICGVVNVDNMPGTYDYKGVVNPVCTIGNSGWLMERPCRAYNETCEVPVCNKLDKDKLIYSHNRRLVCGEEPETDNGHKRPMCEPESMH